MFCFKKHSPTAATALSTKENIGNDLGRIPSKDSGIRAVARFLTVTAFIIAGCSENNNSVANGTGSNAGETELATIAFVKADGTPLARAIARTWSMSEKSMDLVSVDTLDENGQVPIDTSLSSLHLVEARSGDTLSAMSWINFDDSTSQTSLVASASTSLKGNITQNGNSIKGATVKILDKTVTTDSNGNFEVSGIPEGQHFAFVENVHGTRAFQVQAMADSTVDADNVIDLDSEPFILAEDFEQWETRRSLLGRTFGEGWWFVLTDSTLGGGSRLLNEPGQENLFVKESDKGHAMHLVYDLDEETDGRFGVAGFALGDDFENHKSFAFFDLSGATAFSFDAKGSGELFLQLTLRDSTGEKMFVKSTPIELTRDWERYTITTEELDTDLTAVNSINFVVENDAEFYLDDIKIEGISPGMWPELGKNF